VQGQALRDSADRFAECNCSVLGASFDTPAENKAFRDAQEFPFSLLSDVDRTAGRAYDVERSGQYADYPRRRSFLIDPAGALRVIYDVDDVAAHAETVLADLASLR
jgi:thioredoxin-dependent peroxiredoxin